MKHDEINKKLEEIIQLINYDTYTLTRNDIDSVEWRIRDIQKYVNELYISKGIK